MKALMTKTIRKEWLDFEGTMGMYEKLIVSNQMSIKKRKTYGRSDNIIFV